MCHIFSCSYHVQCQIIISPPVRRIMPRQTNPESQIECTMPDRLCLSRCAMCGLDSSLPTYRPVIASIL